MILKSEYAMITLKGFAARLCFTTLLAFAVINGSAADSAAEPEPPIVTPGKDGSAPSDAVVLFDGKDLSAWKGADGVERRGGRSRTA